MPGRVSWRASASRPRRWRGCSIPTSCRFTRSARPDGHPYCALEFVEGGNLAGKIDGKPMPAREAARLVEALARAMQLAHSRNVVHRDLKPANILLTADGTPKITDFGLARQLDSDSGETQAGAVMGTPSYMAPEQASGHAHEAGPAADIYALGAILYDCLAGRPPFQGTDGRRDARSGAHAGAGAAVALAGGRAAATWRRSA